MSNKTRSFAVIAVLFLFIPGCLFAQTPKDPSELSIGSWVPGHLYAGHEYWFSVRSAGTGFLTVETTGSVDTYLEAYDASYNLIDENDDGDGFNARLDLFVESGATYLLKLRGYDEDVTGPYSIRALFEAAPADAGNTERSRAVLLKQDDSIPVFIRSSSESRWYRYDLTRQKNLLIIRTTGNSDTYLKLYDSQGRLLSEDDDSGENNNAMLFERLNPGTYYIEMTLYTGRAGRTTIQAENWYRD
jgi:hypothetical protein